MSIRMHLPHFTDLIIWSPVLTSVARQGGGGHLGEDNGRKHAGEAAHDVHQAGQQGQLSRVAPLVVHPNLGNSGTHRNHDDCRRLQHCTQHAHSHYKVDVFDQDIQHHLRNPPLPSTHMLNGSTGAKKRDKLLFAIIGCSNLLFGVAECSSFRIPSDRSPVPYCPT